MLVHVARAKLILDFQRLARCPQPGCTRLFDLRSNTKRELQDRIARHLNIVHDLTANITVRSEDGSRSILSNNGMRSRTPRAQRETVRSARGSVERLMDVSLPDSRRSSISSDTVRPFQRDRRSATVSPISLMGGDPRRWPKFSSDPPTWDLAHLKPVTLASVSSSGSTRASILTAHSAAIPSDTASTVRSGGRPLKDAAQIVEVTRSPARRMQSFQASVQGP